MTLVIQQNFKVCQKTYGDKLIHFRKFLNSSPILSTLERRKSHTETSYSAKKNPNFQIKVTSQLITSS